MTALSPATNNPLATASARDLFQQPQAPVKSEETVDPLETATAKAEQDAVVIAVLDEALNQDDEADSARKAYLKLGEEAETKRLSITVEPESKQQQANEVNFIAEASQTSYSEFTSDGVSIKQGSYDRATVNQNGIERVSVDIAEAQIETENGSVTFQSLSVSSAYGRTTQVSQPLADSLV